MAISPVILCGGSGSRLWPISDERKPKQFLTLFGKDSMLAQTVARMTAPTFDPQTIFLTELAQAERIAGDMHGEDYVIIGEPCRRNTAAAAVAAALYVRDVTPDDDLMLLAAADHMITDPEAFRTAVNDASDAARNGHIVTFGIHPESPETGYGYIKRGALLSDKVYRVDAFKEKPDAPTAIQYCESGDFDWNAGIFLFSAAHFLAEIARFEPEILDAVTKSYQAAKRDGPLIALDETHFAQAPSTSIDYAVMERTDKAAVVPCDLGWSDIGSYRSLFDIRSKIGASCQPEETKLFNSKDCLVVSDGPQINIIGLDNIGVIVDQGRILVLNLDNAQDVKHVADMHKKSPT